MSTILSKTIISNAKETIDEYTRKADEQFQALSEAISKLIGSGFAGDAATGYQTFFTQKITPALTTYLTQGNTSLMQSLSQMLTDIETQLIGNVDPELGRANSGAGGDGSGN